jgi:2-polyprenyl-3-methyl-5-hydroxy-6-metoxy-1,4-benzoquinol methylase
MLLIIKKISVNSHYKISPYDKSIFKIPDEKKCLICKSTKLFTLYEISASSLENKKLIKKIICKKCGHSFFNKIPKIKKINKYYEKEWNKSIDIKSNLITLKPNYSLWSPIHYINDLKIKKKNKILDFGCGYANSIATLKLNKYLNVYGIEVGQKRYKIASRNFPGKIFKGTDKDLNKITNQIGKFDFIYSNHVFEHLSDPLSVLKNLRKALSFSGIVAISVPAPGSESAIHSSLYYPHLNGYSEQSLKNLLFKAGFKKIRIWVGSNMQLCVVGSLNNRVSFNKNYKTIKKKIKSLSKHLLIRNDFINQIKSNPKFHFMDSDKIKILTFTHPWANFSNNVSGVTKEFGISKLFVKSLDFISSKLFNKISNHKIDSLKIFIRKIFYKIFVYFKIISGIDNIYFLCKDNKTNVLRICFEDKVKFLNK